MDRISLFFMGLGGLIFFVIGLYVIKISIFKKGRCTARTEAMVYEYHEEISTVVEDGIERKTILYYPVFSYHVNGIEYKNKSDTGYGARKYSLGDPVMILYDPEDPAVFEEPGDSKKSLLLGIGSTLVGLGLLIYVFMTSAV